MRKIFIIFMSVLALGSIFIILLSVNKKSTINIYVVPEDSTISVDSRVVGRGHVELSVRNGTHQISASKDDYDTYSKSMSVTKNDSLTIILTQSQNSRQQAGTVNITPFAAGSFQPVSTDTLVAIDSKNLNLIKISKGGITTLYAKPVYVFSFSNPYVVLIEQGNRDKLAVINIDNGNTKNIDAKNFAPVISVSVDSTSGIIYFLGSYDPATRNSTLYKSSLDSFSPQNIGVYTADDVRVLSGNNILLTSSADAADLSAFSIYDVLNNKYLYHTNGNGAIVSPSRQTVAFYSSKSLRAVSVASLEEKNYSYSFDNQKIVWLDSNTLVVLTNTFPGVQFYKINTLSNSQTSNTDISQLKQVSVRSVIGAIENYLFLQDSTGKVWSVSLP